MLFQVRAVVVDCLERVFCRLQPSSMLVSLKITKTSLLERLQVTYTYRENQYKIGMCNEQL